jgi:hypothetical protein
MLSVDMRIPPKWHVDEMLQKHQDIDVWEEESDLRMGLWA